MLPPKFISNWFSPPKAEATATEPNSNFDAFMRSPGDFLVIPVYKEPSVSMLYDARERASTNGYVKRYLEKSTEFALSSQGIRLNFDGIDSPRFVEAWERHTESIGYDGDDLQDLQHRLILILLRDGEDITVIHRGVRAQIIDSAAVEYGSRWITNDDHYMNDGGVILDTNGKVAAYDVRTGHTTTRIPAAQIIHVKRKQDQWRTRGMSWVASALPIAHEHDAYRGSFVKGAIIANRSPVYVNLPMNMDSKLREKLETSGVDISDGKLRFVPEGVEFNIVDLSKNFAGENFYDIKFTLVSEMATGMGITYDFVSGDASKANMSSLQSANIANMTHIREVQRLVGKFTLQMYYRWAIQMIASNQVSARVAAFRPKIKYPRIPSMIPHRDAQVDATLITAGIASPQTIMEERDLDVDEELDRIEEYRRRFPDPKSVDNTSNSV